MSVPEPQAWSPLTGDEERLALEHPWPPASDGGLLFVIDEALYALPHDDRLALYADLARKLLAIFRELVPPGGWLYALDWHHTSYRFDPHVPFETGATLEELTGNYTREHFEQARRGVRPPAFTARWALSVHPGGDPEHVFAPPDFRFVFASRYGVRNLDGREAPGRGPIEVDTYELRGRELIDAVERNLPELFRRARRLSVQEG